MEGGLAQNLHTIPPCGTSQVLERVLMNTRSYMIPGGDFNYIAIRNRPCVRPLPPRSLSSSPGAASICGKHQRRCFKKRQIPNHRLAGHSSHIADNCRPVIRTEPNPCMMVRRNPFGTASSRRVMGSNLNLGSAYPVNLAVLATKQPACMSQVRKPKPGHFDTMPHRRMYIIKQHRKMRQILEQAKCVEKHADAA